MRKIAVVLAILLALILTQVFAVEQQVNSSGQGTSSDVYVDKDNIRSGVIGIKYSNQSTQKVKLIIQNGKSKYVYNLINSNLLERFPLQMGNGQYTLGIYENIEGKSYRSVYSESFDVKIEKENVVYLGSVQLIKWDNSMKAIKKAKEITKNSKSDEEKIKAIYNYVTKNFKYDFDKITKLGYDYLPDIEETYASRKGICFDYSSLFAAMLRSVGISSKLIKGYTSNVKGYHAWNEVYFTKSKKWVIIDTTYDSQLIAAKRKVAMDKAGSKYDKVNEY
jgi:hypothetical protein